MKDCKGNELQIGDTVIYTQKNDPGLRTGTVKKFYKGQFNNDECSVDSTSHVSSNRVMKYNKN